ncbi:hypothetical protein ACFQL7_27945 [Halocatena marina]|uniref:Uncharacterized protein n=1 Tax=Halocatena marina TaxID=2934937 RepID=A0ABD5YV99_9EURY
MIAGTPASSIAMGRADSSTRMVTNSSVDAYHRIRTAAIIASILIATPTKQLSNHDVSR